MSRCADIKGRGVLISANAKTLAAAARRKAEGRKIETPTTSESPKVIDLMNALSLARKKELKKVGSRTMAAEGTPSARRRRVGICTRQPCDRLATLMFPPLARILPSQTLGKTFHGLLSGHHSRQGIENEEATPMIHVASFYPVLQRPTFLLQKRTFIGNPSKRCSEAAYCNDARPRSARCGTRFMAGGVEHVCAFGLEHQPWSLHVCICGARHIEAA